MKQLDLEQMASNILTAPYQRHSETSREAAESMRLDTSTLQLRLLLWLEKHGPATDETMQWDIPMSANTQRPRRVEVVRLGLVRDSGEKRKTRSGRSAVVWEVV